MSKLELKIHFGDNDDIYQKQFLKMQCNPVGGVYRLLLLSFLMQAYLERVCKWKSCSYIQWVAAL